MDRSMKGSLRISMAALFTAMMSAMTIPAAAAPGGVTATAALVHPVTHVYVGTVVEDCSRAPATVTIFLHPSRNIKGTEFLALEPAGTASLSAVVSAQGGSLTLESFGGSSKTGCLPSGSTIMLVYSPGGMLGTLLMVVGEGVVTTIH